MSEPTSPFQIRDFRLIWLARFSSVMATSGMVVIIGYQLYDVARSQHDMTIAQASLLLGLLGLAQFIPFLALTPLAGLVADRFDRRRIAVTATAVDMLIAVALAAGSWAHALSLPMLFALAALHGGARVFLGPALSAIVPNVVPAPLMPRAIALSATAWQVGSLAGPTAAGLLYGSHAYLPYAVAAAMLCISGLAVSATRHIAPPENTGNVHPVRQMIDGFSFVRNERFLLGCVTLDLFAVILGGATALLPVFARDILHVGAEGLGLMRAMPGAGAALVALFLSWRPLNTNVGVKMLWAVVLYGVATIGFGLSRDYLLSLAFLALLGAADMISVFVRTSLVQINTPDDMRGRVSSISGLAISASNELGEMQSGIAAALLGATGAVVFGGVGAIMITVAWAILFPELRNARTFAPQYRQRDKAP